ncbi:MAG: hypothetical protein ACRCT8_00400 [Lacipirellulaceae bacterium]
MNCASQSLRVFLAAVVFASPGAASANPLEFVIDQTHNAGRFFAKDKPASHRDFRVEQVAKEIDWLEHKIETFGSVVPKQPDIWGEARMTKHRQEVEYVLQNQLGRFQETLQGSLRRSDQSFLAAALTLDANAGNPSSGVPNAATLVTDGEFTTTGTSVSRTDTTTTAEDGTKVVSNNVTTSPAALQQTGNVHKFASVPARASLAPSRSLANVDGSETPLGISLEPTIVNDQLFRYLNHLNELRRLNEGDDTSDSPGYSLNLIRIPVSLLPGKMTRRGYGAEASFTIAPQLTDDLLPSTMRTLVVNDVVNLHAPAVARALLADPSLSKSELEQFEKHRGQVSRWMTAYDAWLDLLQSQADIQPTDDLLRTIDYFHALRSYIEYRFFQIADAAKKQVDRKGELVADDFVVCKSIQLNEIAPDLACTLALTYVDLEQWLDSVASTASGMSVTCPQPMTATVAKGLLRRTQFAELGRVGVFPVKLKANLIDPLAVSASSHSSPCLPLDIAVEPLDSEAKDQAVQVLFGAANAKQQARIETVSDLMLLLTPAQANLLLQLELEQTQVLLQLTPEQVLKLTAQQAQDMLRITPEQAKTLVKFSPDLREKIRIQADSRASDESSILSVDSRIKEVLCGIADRYSGVISRHISNSDDYEGQFFQQMSATSLPTNQRASRRPMSPSNFIETIGFSQFLHVLEDANQAGKRLVASESTHSFLDVRAFLHEEANTAYDWLAAPAHAHLWQEHATPALAEAVNSRNFAAINLARRQFFSAAGTATDKMVVSSLAWSIIIDAALLNDRLLQDMKRVAAEKECDCLSAEGLSFVGPIETIDPAAQQAFKEYVRCRWPIQVFALDPVTQDQNIADVYSRRREMQLALAVGVSKGTIRGSAAMRYARQLEMDLETISLNRTAVAFSHANDTFGWRFYPRVQAPDTPNTLGVFWESIAGGPDKDADLRDCGIEPGVRECTAIVVMPSFVPHVTIESRGSWFGLTNPRKKALTMHDTMKISRNYQAVRNTLRCARESGCYRPGDVSHMTTVVDQMEKRLPLQHMLLPVPFENTSGGHELFNAGITDLAPELYGWFGAPGVTVGRGAQAADGSTTTGASGTTIFLVGARFSVHDTQVIAGGRCVPYQLVSREIMKVTIPTSAETVSDTLSDGKTVRQYVDVHVATPYGVTSHLLVRAHATEEEEEAEATAKTIKALTERVELIARDTAFAAVSVDPATGLVLHAMPKGHSPGVTLTPELGGTTISLRLANQSRTEVEGTLQVALFDKQFLTHRIDVAGGVTIGEDSTDLQVSRQGIADALTAAFGGSVTSGDFDENGERNLRGVLYLRANEPNALDQPTRLLGELPIKLALVPAECRATTAVENKAAEELPPLPPE